MTRSLDTNPRQKTRGGRKHR